MSAKIKRLKALLTKSGTISKEKDAEISLLKKKVAAELKDKWTSLRVLMKVEVCHNSSALKAEQADIWCFVVNEKTDPQSDEPSIRSCQSKWILESELSHSIEENEVMVVDSVPECTLQQTHLDEITELEECHQASMDYLRAEMATVTQNFQAYKVSCMRNFMQWQ